VIHPWQIVCLFLNSVVTDSCKYASSDGWLLFIPQYAHEIRGILYFLMALFIKLMGQMF